MSRIRVARFEGPDQAEPIRQRLTQNGIPAEVHKESRLAVLWYVSRRSAGARLEVPAKDAERARRLLLEWDTSESLMHRAVRCPECRSLRVDYPQFTQRSLFANFAMGLVAELGLVEREYYCEDCHCMWQKQQTRPRRARRHMAPDYFLENVRLEPPREVVDRRALSDCSLKVPRSQKCPGWRRGGRINALSRWKILGGMLLLLGSHYGLIAADPQVSPATAIASEARVNKLVTPSRRSTSATSNAPTYFRDVLPILMGKCARCHEDQSRVMPNWLDYSTAASRRWEIKRRVWDSWKGAYFKQPMPTGNSPEAEAMTEAERTLIRDWVKSGALGGELPAFNSVQSKADRIELGKRLFTTICAACHQPMGQGIPGRFPPLAGSDLLNADKQRAIKIVINGLQGEVVVNGQSFNNSMPQFPLSDEEVASALTYVYNSFGNSGKDVTPGEVSAVRREKHEVNFAGHSQGPRTPEEKSPYE
jgi:mono/diheme cytochrome c family protein